MRYVPDIFCNAIISFLASPKHFPVPYSRQFVSIPVKIDSLFFEHRVTMRVVNLSLSPFPVKLAWPSPELRLICIAYHLYGKKPSCFSSVGIQMKRFYPNKIFGKKRIPSEVLPVPCFYRNDREIMYHLYLRLSNVLF